MASESISATVIFRAILYWLGWFLCYTGFTIVVGVLLGALIFVVVGAFTHPEKALLDRLLMGVRIGAIYAGVWAGGLAIVLCFIRGHRRNREKAAASEAASAFVDPKP